MVHRIEIWKLKVSAGIVLDLTRDIISYKYIWPSGIFLSEFEGIKIEFSKFSPLRAGIYLLYL